MAFIVVNLGNFGEQTYDIDIEEIETETADEDYELALKCINNLDGLDNQIELLRSLKKEIEEKLEDVEDKK